VPGPSPELGEAGRARLLEVARLSLASCAETGRAVQVDPAREEPALQRLGASFVTLRREGALRGCVGSVEATRPLVLDVAENTRAAALRDRRFSPVSPGEVPSIEVSLSVLSPMERIAAPDEATLAANLEPGVHGLMLVRGPRRGVLLPQVWGDLPDASAFIDTVRRKAGMKRDFYDDALEAYRFTVTKF